jgi:hypothetical protein
MIMKMAFSKASLALHLDDNEKPYTMQREMTLRNTHENLGQT